MEINEIVDILTSHRTIGKAPREELVWIAEHGTLRHFQQGEVVARVNEVVPGLHILLTGRMAIFVKRESGLRKMMEWQGGDVTGILPYSRMITPPGDTIVEEPSDSVSLVRDDLPGLIQNCYEVTAILVHVMTDRARRFTSTDLRDEKMISLGKLAAGFAHEVNNPSSAALRDAKSLASTLGSAEEAARALFASGLTGPQLSELDALWSVCKPTTTPHVMTGLQLADREDSITEWLSEQGMSKALAEELARTAITTDDLSRLARTLQGATLEAALRWIAGAYSARLLAINIERATTRIHALVAAAKGFTHMDRAPILEFVDIFRGLEDTIALLAAKARAKSVMIALNIPQDFPPIRGYTVEINQVWMNLLDNAIDAAPNNGQVNISAKLDGADVIVSVVDNGAGIPPDIQESIFDPFFTTKPVGEGTGLGLDIVRRVVHWHNGHITVNSRPGHTEFQLTLPVGGPG